MTEELWRARQEGRLSVEESERMLAEHVVGICPECAEAHAAALTPRHDYGPVFTRLIGNQRVLMEQVEEERRGAERDLEELLELPASERAGRIERARTRFGSALLAERLLERSFDALPQDPRRSLHFAELADKVVTVNPRRGSGEAKVRALAHKGNALRALGELSDAVRCFDLTRKLLRDGVPVEGCVPEAVVDSEVYGFVDFCEGTYWKVVGNFPAAEESLNRAAMLYAVAEAESWVHRVILTLADVYAEAGNYADAIEAVGSVLVNLAEEDDRKLYWVARLRHADYLALSGVYDDARRELRSCAAAMGEDAGWRRRIRWIEGGIAVDEGKLGRAEAALLEVRSGFLEEGSGINMAIASLDLGVVYLKQGRTVEVKRLAEEMGLIFEAQDVHREAIAALLLFQEAARREQLTLREFMRLRRYLKAARQNPTLVYERAS